MARPCSAHACGFHTLMMNPCEHKSIFVGLHIDKAVLGCYWQVGAVSLWRRVACDGCIQGLTNVHAVIACRAWTWATF